MSGTTIGGGRAGSGDGTPLTLSADGCAFNATNGAGGDLFLASGIPTGNGRSTVRLQNYVRGASGTADADPIDKVIIPMKKDLTVTGGTPTNICTLDVPSGTMGSVGIDWSSHATHTNGTDFGIYAARTIVTVINKAGTFTTTSTETGNTGSTTIALNTFTLASSVSTAGSTATIRLTPSYAFFTPASVVLHAVYHNTCDRTLTVL